MVDLSDQVVMVTGGARGQGRSHAAVLSQAGASVIVCDVDVAAGTELERGLRQEGHAVRFVELDVSRRDDWERALEFAEATFGAVTALVNNAGIAVPSSILDFTDEEFHRVVNVNQLGVLLGMQVVGRRLADRGGGAIVNTSSTLGTFASPATVVYQGTKAAVLAFTKSGALLLGRYGVRVNAVLPGLVDTDFIAPHRRQGSTALEDSISRTPLGRIGEPSEISAAVKFLLTEGASYVNGAEIVVDGGMTAGSAKSLQNSAARAEEEA